MRLKDTIHIPLSSFALALTLAVGCGGGSNVPIGSYDGDECNQAEAWVWDPGPCISHRWCIDADGDGYSAGTGCYDSCERPAGGYSTAAGDCDDAAPSRAPDAPEACNGLDDDCDGRTDEDAPGDRIYYADTDGDGHGAGAPTSGSCALPAGTSLLDDDCAPRDASTHPGAAEAPDGRDNDCDGEIDEALADADYDGDGVTLAQGDCDDADAAVHPGAAEVCDDRDNDCDGAVDDADDAVIGAPTWAPDADGDGSPGVGEGIEACASPGEGWAQGPIDCDDGDPTRAPGLPERWGDDVDDDCDGLAPSADAYVSAAGAWVAEGATGPTYPTLGAALGAAKDGETIAVEPGTWRETVDFRGVNARLISMAGPDATVIHPKGGSAAVFTHGEGEAALLQGFTLTGGTGTDGSRCGLAPGLGYGGGVCIRGSSPTLTGNRITRNQVTGSGGGIYIEDGSPTLLTTLVEGNVALYDGGGINVSRSAAILSQLRIVGNEAGRSGGGAVFNAATLTLDHSVVEGNRAQGHLAPPATLEGPLGGGGMILTSGSRLALDHVVLAGNRAETAGGAIQLYADARDEEDASALTLRHAVLTHNEAGGLGGGIHLSPGAVTVEASILAANDAEEGGPNLANQGGSFTSDASLYFADGAAGLGGEALPEGAIVADPRLLAPGAAPADVHLGLESPAIDAAGAAAGDADAHGGPADLGAYGGDGGGGWDLDGDGLPAYTWPGAADAPPDDVTPGAWDCDDGDGSVGACAP